MSTINTQFSVAMHILCVLCMPSPENINSAFLADSVFADRSFVRKTMAKLVKAGLIVSTSGRNAYSELARPAEQITLLSVYEAVEAPDPFAIHSYPEQKKCPVSSNIKETLEVIQQQARDSVDRVLSQHTIADVYLDICRRNDH